MRHALSISMWAILMIGGPVLAQTSGTDDVFSDVSQDSTSKVVNPDVVLATKITFQASAEQSNIGHLCRELADMVPEVNFVVGPDAARVQLPDLDFENLSLATVLQLVPEITKQRVSMDFNSIEQRPVIACPMRCRASTGLATARSASHRGVAADSGE